ncbi:MAG: PD-(D/E)XK nuclease family protein [Pseudomonadota bacterium]|nr:PD-(D/E)XK nuclease family protein [Pseudomonadota bacterium]
MSLRDAVFLVPFAQHLPLARQAWSAQDAWMPRVETTQTLARSQAPPEPAADHDICFDAALDLLTARRLLRGQAAFAGWPRQDARAFDQAATSLMQTAQAIARAIAAVPPIQREAHHAAVRDVLGALGGVGGTERHLARIAFEWAAATTAPSTDLLFSLRPSAWIVVQAGGADRLTQRLVDDASTTCPVLWIDADPPGDDPIQLAAPQARVQVQVCSGFEDEAQRAAAQVIADLTARGAPVALIAQDRLLVRRIRALLGRQGVPLRDETGWTLSTTRAGASIGLLLRAASATATVDEVLDAIKSWPVVANDPAAVASLESTLRRQHWARPAAVDLQRLAAPAAALWEFAARAMEPLRGAGSQTLVNWCLRLRAALQSSGLAAALASDDAGQQVLAALHLGVSGVLAGHTEPHTLADCTRWVDASLEQATYVPASPDAPAVIVIPPARAMLRPFAAIVWPGADDRHLGATPSPHPLLKDAEVEVLGLPTAAQRRERETIAFAQALRCAPVTLLRRTDDDGEPVSPSPLLERLVCALREAGLPALAIAPDARIEKIVPPSPVAQPLPSAPALLPDRLSASACEALRACPYRFFALRMLGLQPADELDGEVEKRDYGTWLHAVLHRFHLGRPVPAGLPAGQHDDARALAVAAIEAQAEMGLTDADFLPFAATFERFAPRYIDWLHGRDRDGAQWLDGERDWTVHPQEWQGIAMHGVIDRIDSVSGNDGTVTQLIDYKTGGTAGLRLKVKQPQEDTQLPFYAALAIEQGRLAGEIGPLDAIYLSLDDAQKIVEVRHPDVERSAVALVEGLGQDLARLRGGAVLPALGEGDACDYCDARGLCRRDQWAVGPAVGGLR